MSESLELVNKILNTGTKEGRLKGVVRLVYEILDDPNLDNSAARNQALGALKEFLKNEALS